MLDSPLPLDMLAVFVVVGSTRTKCQTSSATFLLLDPESPSTRNREHRDRVGSVGTKKFSSPPLTSSQLTTSFLPSSSSKTRTRRIVTMFGGAPRQPSPAEAAAARLQARNTLKQFAVYAAGLWTGEYSTLPSIHMEMVRKAKRIARLTETILLRLIQLLLHFTT